MDRMLEAYDSSQLTASIWSRLGGRDCSYIARSHECSGSRPHVRASARESRHRVDWGPGYVPAAGLDGARQHGASARRRYDQIRHATDGTDAKRAGGRGKSRLVAEPDRAE